MYGDVEAFAVGGGSVVTGFGWGDFDLPAGGSEGLGGGFDVRLGSVGSGGVAGLDGDGADGGGTAAVEERGRVDWAWIVHDEAFLTWYGGGRRGEQFGPE